MTPGVDALPPSPAAEDLAGLNPYGTRGDGEFAPPGAFVPPEQAPPTLIPPARPEGCSAAVTTTASPSPSGSAVSSPRPHRAVRHVTLPRRGAWTERPFFMGPFVVSAVPSTPAVRRDGVRASLVEAH
ncbi:hypothetical protein GCM10023335_45060 [Streptomyces siamensis]|uniref:Uncharacterized protein n=1 Tax=Streptomyces siamensis TaxID=1274986 RepID=A0ABP9J3U6_9ACTN